MLHDEDGGRTRECETFKARRLIVTVFGLMVQNSCQNKSLPLASTKVVAELPKHFM